MQTVDEAIRLAQELDLRSIYYWQDRQGRWRFSAEHPDWADVYCPGPWCDRHVHLVEVADWVDDKQRRMLLKLTLPALNG